MPARYVVGVILLLAHTVMIVWLGSQSKWGDTSMGAEAFWFPILFFDIFTFIAYGIIGLTLILLNLILPIAKLFTIFPISTGTFNAFFFIFVGGAIWFFIGCLLGRIFLKDKKSH